MSTCAPCLPVCRNPFARVLVSRALAIGTKVTWSLLPSFSDPLPHTFTLFFGRTGGLDSDDWEQVGLSVTNQFYGLDTIRRDWGVVSRARYKVRLETSAGAYESEPTFAAGTLGHRNWRIVREAVRQRKLHYRKGKGAKGWLLKRRVVGDKCPVCADHQTGEPTNPDCPSCYGTGYRCGYFYPLGCSYVLFQPRGHMIDLDMSRGPVSKTAIRVDMLALDLIETGDIWVDDKTDDRYEIKSVENVAEVERVPVAATVTMNPIPLTNGVYDIPIPQRELELL